MSRVLYQLSYRSMMLSGKAESGGKSHLTQWSPLYLTSSPRLKPGDSQGRTPVYKKIGSNVTVLLRRHATLILEGHAKSPLDSCSKSNPSRQLFEIELLLTFP